MWGGKAEMALVEARKANEAAAAASAAAVKASEAIATHTAVCAERQTRIDGNFDDIKDTMKWAMRGGIVLLLTVIGTLIDQLQNHHHIFGADVNTLSGPRKAGN